MEAVLGSRCGCGVCCRMSLLGLGYPLRFFWLILTHRFSPLKARKKKSTTPPHSDDSLVFLSFFFLLLFLFCFLDCVRACAPASVALNNGQGADVACARCRAVSLSLCVQTDSLRVCM